MMNDKGNYWRTPLYIFEPLDEIFHFWTDVAADGQNALCYDYISEEMDAHKTRWSLMNWCNPPYGRGLFEPFVDSALREMEQGNRTVMLHKCDPSTRTFQKTWGLYHYFYYNRIKFVGAPNSANFPVCLTLFGEYTAQELQALKDLKQGELKL